MINDCHGNKKKEILTEYFIDPLALIKLLPDQIKSGCCGELKDKYYIFKFSGIADRSKTGVFFVGIDCGNQMIELINEKRKNAGSSPINTPPLFNAMIDNGFLKSHYPTMHKTNKEALSLILLLASVWNVQNFYGAPAMILEKIVRFPEKHIDSIDLEKIMSLIIKQAEQVNYASNVISIGEIFEAYPKLGRFNFPRLEGIFGYMSNAKK